MVHETAYAKQTRRANRVLDSVQLEHVTAASALSWKVVRQHSTNIEGAGCQCVVIEVVAALQDLGYTLIGPGPGEPDG